MKFKKNDEVLIMSGKDKGKKGKISQILNDRVLLPSLNVGKRHVKKRDEKNPGGIIEFSRPLPVGNIALLCPKCGKPTRVGYVIKGDSKKRICKKCEAII
jgi:large subunit ribosomal protein L24